jgi:hypothetical protein
MTKTRYDALITAAVRNFSIRSTNAVSKEQFDAELAVTEKEWEDAKKSFTAEAFEEWHTARTNEHRTNWEEMMVPMRGEVDALLRDFNDLFGDYASIKIKKDYR